MPTCLKMLTEHCSSFMILLSMGSIHGLCIGGLVKGIGVHNMFGIDLREILCVLQ